LFLFFEGVHQKGRRLRQRPPRRPAQGRLHSLLPRHHQTGELSAAKTPPALIAVRADSSHQDDIPPLDIGYAHYGGIYRDVWLIATDQVHFELTDHASPGVFIDTPQVSNDRATLRIRGTVVNESDKERAVSVQLALTDPSGKPTGQARANIKIPTSQKSTFDQTIEIPQPQLWSPDSPHLYNLTATIQDDEKPLDQHIAHTAFRFFKFDPSEGFSLNGQRLHLRGASRHQDYANLGSALPNSIHRSDLQWLKDMGANFIRLAHYPQDPEVLDTADRIGLIVWEEIPIVSTMSPSADFAAVCKDMLQDMIRQHYNHPSVVMWGIMNETLLNWGRTPNRDPEFPNHVKKLAVELDALVRKEDLTRVSTMAMNTGPSYDTAGISDITQIAGWNIYAGWYGPGFENFGKFLDTQHEKFPKRILFVSEYGAGSDERLHSLKPQRFDHSVEWMQLYHESYLRQIAKRPYLAGVAIWNQFDFSQPEAGDSIPHMNQKGMLTFDRRPKDVYYLYQANWSTKPMLHIATREWLRRSGGVAPATARLSSPKSRP
jgi:beta-galactosidase